MNNVVLGRYVPYDSFIHKMDPRAKILALIALMVAVFIPFSTYEVTFIAAGFVTVFVVILLCISRIRIIDVFKSLSALWLFVVILLVINVFIPPVGSATEAFSIGKVTVYWESIFQSLKIILRLVLMIELTMVLTATTKPLDLTYALEWYLTPLKIIKFPAHEVAMTISIALRFIPTLLDETERIMKAQSSRGVDFKHGKITSRLKAVISLIIPLFISSFQRSEELADSMEARGYDPKAERTRYRVLKFNISDLFATLLCFILLAGLIVVSECGFTLETNLFINWLAIGFLGIILYIFIFGLVESLKRIKQ